MKYAIPFSLLATPAFAHGTGILHTHSMELVIAVSVIAGLAALVWFDGRN